MDKKKCNTTAEAPNVPASTSSIQLGVWRILLQKESPLDFQKQWSNLFSTISLIHRFATEIFHLGPWLFISFIVSKVWTGIESALLLYLSSRILTIVSRASAESSLAMLTLPSVQVEVGLTKGQVHAIAIFSAVAARLICVAIVAVMKWWRWAVPDHTQLNADFNILTAKSFVRLWQVGLLAISSCTWCEVWQISCFMFQSTYFSSVTARLQVDLPTSQGIVSFQNFIPIIHAVWTEYSSKSRATARKAWISFDAIVRIATGLITMASQLAFIIQSFRSSGGPFFALLCVAKPIMRAVSRRSLWSKCQSSIHSANL